MYGGVTNQVFVSYSHTATEGGIVVFFPGGCGLSDPTVLHRGPLDEQASLGTLCMLPLLSTPQHLYVIGGIVFLGETNLVTSPYQLDFMLLGQKYAD